MQQYTTIQGDTFDIIAKKIYGDEKYIRELLYANLENAHIIIFSAGTVLNIPDINTEQIPQSTSPWRD